MVKTMRQLRRNVHYVQGPTPRPVCGAPGQTNLKRPIKTTVDLPLVSCVPCLRAIVNARMCENVRLKREIEKLKNEARTARVINI